MSKDIRKSILAGLLICIGGVVNLSCIAKGYAWLGAFLFASGLFTICEYGFNLYTGKVGYISNNFRDANYMGFVALVCVVNLVTTYLVGVLVGYTLPGLVPVAQNIYSPKLLLPLWKPFVSSIFCGILMYLAVDTWKRGTKIGVFIFVATFILSGFDHSIANSFYNGVALGFNAFTLENALFVIIVVLGNGIGGNLVPLLRGKE